MVRELYNVYVIALKKQAGKVPAILKANPDRDEHLPIVYVGQTAHTPEYRFEQHLNGYKANRYVKKYGYALLFELFEKYNPLPDRETAERIEQELAESLRRQGYTVWYG